MNSNVLPFVCGAVIGAAAASVAWSISASPSEPAAEASVAAEPVVEPAPEPAPVLAEPDRPIAGPKPEEASFDGVPPPAEDAAPPQQQAGNADARPEERRERRGPPRWEDMTDEQREEMRKGFHKMMDERQQKMAAAFVERNGLAETDTETILGIADGVNERALERLQRWTDYLQLQGAAAIPKDQGARVMRDLFDDLVKGYDELDAAFGESWRQNDPDFDLGQMIAPEVWGSLFRLGGGMGGPGGRGPGGRGPGGRRGPNGSGNGSR